MELPGLQIKKIISINTIMMIVFLLFLAGCGGGSSKQKMPEELKKAIENISNLDEIQSETEKQVRSDAIGVFLKYAKKGNIEAMYWVAEGRLLDKREENYVSITETIRWLQKAAEGGHSRASRELGLIYSTEKGVKDIERAYMWYYIGYYLRDGKVHEYNEKETEPAVGDFRNETMVEPLVKSLGPKKIKAIEEKAKAWLAKNNK